MAFTSFHFLVFFGVVLALNAALWRRFELRKSMLLVASYYFYMTWDWRLAGLLAYMTAVNFVAGRQIALAGAERTRNLWLWFAVLSSVGCLGVFKYFGFFSEALAGMLAGFGFHVDPVLVGVAVPVGLSFYTFQSLSYALDVHARREEPCSSLKDFALFVSFFPSLLSGPITRSRQLLPQFAYPGRLPMDGLRTGLPMMLRGVVKKVAIADVLAIHFVNPAFGDPTSYSAAFLAVALVAYSFQIYMDLSGYTDIVRGAARMLGFELPSNFNRPYLATSISNFWQRWHISMSGFFRDYLYFGLGGSKRGNVYINLLLTFIVIGVWHGAGWNFVLYGILHGSLVCLERYGRSRRTVAEGDARSGMPVLSAPIAILATFAFVVSTRVLFRSTDIGQAGVYVANLLMPSGSEAPWSVMGVGALLVAIALHAVPSRISDGMLVRVAATPAVVQAGFACAVVLLTVALRSGEAGFVYFQF
jgi:D-alanyl-lipoteichoic acid acyltransferase DltB (MBOAT superfamily)